MSTSAPKTPAGITVVDLFSGCGGFTQGFHEFRPAGLVSDTAVFHSVAAVEHDAAAAATYDANFGKKGSAETGLPPAEVCREEIESWVPTGEAMDAEVVVGGPPCQGFSALNRKKKGAERNRLWDEYVRIVQKIRPKVFVIENVDRFLVSDEFQSLTREVSEGGRLSEYRLVDPPGWFPHDTERQRASKYLLNAADYGAPQARRRAIVIGVRRDCEGDRALTYPERTHSRTLLHAGVLPTQGITEDLLPWVTTDSIFAESAELPLREPDLTGMEDFPDLNVKLPGIFSTSQLHFRRNPALLSQARYRAIPEGGNRKDLYNKWFIQDQVTGEIEILDASAAEEFRTKDKYLSTESWDNHHNGSGDVMGRLRKGHPSVTIRTEFYKPEKGRYLHPTEHRPITHYEAARIQGFPLNFRWCGTKTQIATQIGNAVPVPLGKAIAGAIHSFLRD